MMLSDLQRVYKEKPIKVQCNDSVWSVFTKMKNAKVGIALVYSEDKIVGFYSEKIHYSEQRRNPQLDPKTRVENLMKNSFYFIEGSRTIEDCIQFMKKKGIKNLPVLLKNKIEASVSIEFLYEKVLEEKNALIEQLESYIAGQFIKLEKHTEPISAKRCSVEGINIGGNHVDEDKVGVVD